MAKILVFAHFFLAVASPLSLASTVVLKSGETVEGNIIGTSSDQIYFESGARILNYPYRDIREITDFSPEEVRRGFNEEVLENLAASSSSLAVAQEIVSREFSPDQLKIKMRSFKEFISRNFSNELKADEKGVLESLGEALDMPAPAPPPPGETVNIEAVIAGYAPYQSDLHEKILNLMMRYLNEWIAQVEKGGSSFTEEERFLERIVGRARLAVLRSALPSMETVRDTVRRHLANLAELRYAAAQVGVKSE